MNFINIVVIRRNLLLQRIIAIKKYRTLWQILAAARNIMETKHR